MCSKLMKKMQIYFSIEGYEETFAFKYETVIDLRYRLMRNNIL